MKNASDFRKKMGRFMPLLLHLNYVYISCLRLHSCFRIYTKSLIQTAGEMLPNTSDELLQRQIKVNVRTKAPYIVRPSLLAAELASM